jgi:hypothetical protein
MHRIECSGRTQRSCPRPSAWTWAREIADDLGTTSATISAAGGPVSVMDANQTCPFLSSRASSWSFVRPVERRNPSSAFSGASVRGPLRSSVTVGLSAAQPLQVSVRRRGVA